MPCWGGSPASEAYARDTGIAYAARVTPAIASLAKAQGSDAYLEIAAESIQIHGGLGFTWEQDVHLYFKRAKASEVFLGDPTHHRELLARRWGI